MRYGREHKQRTRDAIVTAAGRLFREQGYRAVGVDAIMAAVGLTPGSFYSHFKSKQALFVEAMAGLTTRFEDLLEAGGLSRLISAYLGREHRDLAADGCPLPTLGPDCANGTPAARRSFEQRLRQLEAALREAWPTDQAAPGGAPLALLAQLVGGMVLARAVDDSEYSEQILRACRASARTQAGVASTPATSTTRRSRSNKLGKLHA